VHSSSPSPVGLRVSSECFNAQNPEVLAFVLDRLHDTPLSTLVQSIQRVHIALIELELEHIGITCDPAGSIALRNGRPSFLQRPPHKDLVGGLLMFLSDGVQCFAVGFLVADEGCVGGYHNVGFGTVGDDFTLLAPWVELSIASAFNSSSTM
jgi:hypothetical protein